MKLKCVNLAPGLNSAVFFWEEGEEGKRHKVVQSIGLNDEVDVNDITGHEIIAKYKEAFKVVSYGASSPKTTMLKEERNKAAANGA